MDWSMTLAQAKGILYFHALLAHPCPVDVFLCGQYPCLGSTVSCFFLSPPSCFCFPYFLFTFISHLPSSPLPCATYLCVDHICSLLHLFFPILLPPLQDMLSVVHYHFSDQSLMVYNFLRGHVVSRPSWGAFVHPTHFSKIRLAL